MGEEGFIQGRAQRKGISGSKYFDKMKFSKLGRGYEESNETS